MICIQNLCIAQFNLPSLASRIKPNLWKGLIENKEIIVNAQLKDIPTSDFKKYSFYAGMLVGATPGQARDVITDYALYSKIIPYVDRTRYSASNHILQLEGGIWNFRLRSEILFDEKTDGWIHYRIVKGHFNGLAGDIYFEPEGEKGTAVYITGEQLGNFWPPKFVIERGAEIVFDFTAKRLRSYIESNKKVQKGVGNGNQQEIPQPRTHL